MSSLNPIFITGWNKGLQTNKKPFLLPDHSMQVMENCYCWRERILKREGEKFLGRLSKIVPLTFIGNSGAVNPWNFNLFNLTSIPEINPELKPGSVTINIGVVTFNDNGNGTFSATHVDNSGTINYATGDVSIITTLNNIGSEASFTYFPCLPVMGIGQIEQTTLLNNSTIWFDTKYAYKWTGLQFEEFISGTGWNAQNYSFFQFMNYIGDNPEDRLLFVTNNQNDASNPMRYTNSSTWTTFAPAVTSTTFMFQALILVAYYGRLLALNVTEGDTIVGAKQITNRCRYSQQGSPIDPLAWRTDIFGRGGIIDAPTNEDIVGAMFVKNTLVVTFESTTWQLRYVGEYGPPFIWERVSADFGSDSTFSTVLFENTMLSIGDKAIIGANGYEATRIDLDIPDQIFNFNTANNGSIRVQGIRDYQKELVYWAYPDSTTQAAIGGIATTFPNKVLVYNYRNATWAIFRDNVTAFGNFLQNPGITWDSTDVYWDDDLITWDDPTGQDPFPNIVAGNQQGFVHLYAYTSDEIDGSQSLSIRAINVTIPVTLTIINHNLQTGEIVYLDGALFLDNSGNPIATNLNGKTYRVVQTSSVSQVTLELWDTNTQRYIDNFSPTPVAPSVYTGGGHVTLLPKLNLTTKDFNIYQDKGMQTKLSRLEFLMEPNDNTAMTVNLFVNSSPALSGNLLIGNKTTDLTPSPPIYSAASDYAWFRFYATLFGQYFNINVTFDDNLMNSLETHRNGWTMYAINAWVRPGGKMV